MSPAGKSTLGQLPSGIWVLGFVSLLMDISSEMIHSLLPLFMVTSLGASALVVGVIEGLAEATALMVKVFSGVLSDYLGRRKGLALFGYALGALTKPVFAALRTPSNLPKVVTTACSPSAFSGWAFGNPKSPCRNNAATRSAATTCAGWAAPTGGWSGSAGSLPWPASAKPSSCCAHSSWV